MKNILATALLVACTTYLIGQSTLNFTPLRTEMKDSISRMNTGNRLLTVGGLDQFFAVKTAKYFGSAGDLTQYNNYFFGNIADGTLSFGRNFTLEGQDAPRKKNILSLGIQAQAEDNFSSIYSNDGYAGQLGIDFKYSHICRGKIKYSTGIQFQKLHGGGRYIPNDTATMRVERMKILGELLAQMSQDSSDFMESISLLSQSEQKEQSEAFQKKKTNHYWNSLAESEATALEDEHAYGSAKISWWSIGFHAPFTGRSYLVAPSLSDPFIEREDWQAYVEGSYTRVRDSRRFGLTLLTASVKFGNYNNIETGELGESTITKYQLLGGKDTLALTEVGKQSLYVGELKRFNVTTLQARLVHFFPGDLSWLGLSATYKYEIAQKNTMNLAFGIPVSLTGQEEDSKVNVELQFRIIDLTDEIPDSGDREFNYQFGLNVGIPFGGVDL